MDVVIKIAIADPSIIIRSGLSMVLKKIQGYHIHTIDIPSKELLLSNLKTYKPDFLFINPIYWGTINKQEIQKSSNLETLRCFALVSGFIDTNILKLFDDNINLYDNTETIKKKLDSFFEISTDDTDENQPLSNREKEIIVGVVKGYTNKEIAANLFLSIHTVVTHRRNIARKLDIHSSSGLTIYAIINKLVELDEIKQP